MGQKGRSIVKMDVDELINLLNKALSVARLLPVLDRCKSGKRADEGCCNSRANTSFY